MKDLNLEPIQPKLKIKISSNCQDFSSQTLDIPKYNNLIQLVEIKRNRTLVSDIGDYSDFDGSYVCLNNVRPELFVRRDFITHFVLQGEVFVIHKEPDKYQLFTNNNILSIVLDRYHYDRFGLIGKRLKEQEYQVDIDLKDERILQSNKWQDKLVTSLKRLAQMKRVFVRWVPSNRHLDSRKVILDFFLTVIEEYKRDGFQPIPLSDCYQFNQKVEKRWINKSQLHPSLEMRVEQRVADIVDWLGFQLISVDCNQEEICSKYMCVENKERHDVECVQLAGIYDSRLIETCLRNLFRDKEGSDSILFRAIFLYNRSCEKDLTTIIMQECNNSIRVVSLRT